MSPLQSVRTRSTYSLKTHFSKWGILLTGWSDAVGPGTVSRLAANQYVLSQQLVTPPQTQNSLVSVVAWLGHHRQNQAESHLHSFSKEIIVRESNTIVK